MAIHEECGVFGIYDKAAAARRAPITGCTPFSTGVREVHMLSSAPMFISPCYFGTDIPSKGELFACNHDPEEMRRLIGADSLGFLPVESLHKIAPDCTCGFCDGCFTENYPIPIEIGGEN